MGSHYVYNSDPCSNTMKHELVKYGLEITYYSLGIINWRILTNKEIYANVKKPTIIETVKLNRLR
jgi:hypothetical protein